MVGDKKEGSVRGGGKVCACVVGKWVVFFPLIHF